MALAPSMFLLSLFQFIILPLCITSQQITSPIKVGSILSTNNSTWNSPSGDFAFGFRQIDDFSYLLSIWYANIPDTIVWYAGADGILASKGSVLKCTVDQGLVLDDPQGNNLWSANISTASNCVLNDTGNLMIKGSQGDTLWQSFDHPRDTFLPSQKIGNLGSGGPKIYSRRSKSNFTRGKFQLRLLDDGNLVLNTRSLVTDFAYDGAYYVSGTNNASNPGNMVNYDDFGQMYILKNNGGQVDLFQGQSIPSANKDYYFKATLNYDGVFALYYHEKTITSGSTSWTIIAWQPDNICSSKTGTMDGGVCGYNSICKINNNDGDFPSPTCECPPKYSLVDPSDPFGSCKPDFRSPSDNEHTGYRLEKLAMADWPLRDYDMLDPISEDECKNSCLNDFICVAIIVHGQTCWKKAFPLINGRIDPTRTAFLKVSDFNDDGNNNSIIVPDMRRNWKGMNLLTSALMGTSVFVNFVLVAVVVGFWFFCQREYRASRTVNNPLVMRWNNITCFTYTNLEEAAHGFKEELGRGACAIVYKGVICGSETLVAVKKIDRALLREADKEFKTEVSVIGKTHHKNLVRLVGFCHEEEHRMLVYELMRNGSLAHFLFGDTRPSWSVRVQIAQGIAGGLLYLHEECGSQIIHCDIKPQNILLDDYFEARISDFGLSKLLMLNQFQNHTAIRGTKGYVAPEWFGNKPMTVKVDVYSFGVVLLELISCRRCINMETNEEERAILIDWALDCYQLGDISSLVDNDLKALNDKVRLEKFLKVAIWCIQEDPNLRPTMRQVTLILEGVIEVSSPPGLDQNSLIV